MNINASAGTRILHAPTTATYVFTLSVPRGAELYKLVAGKAVLFPRLWGDAQCVSVVRLAVGTDVYCRGVACNVHASVLPEQTLIG